MLLDYSYGKAFERLQVWWQEIVLCTMRTGALPCLLSPMDAGQVSSTFITPRMESGSTLVFAALTCCCHHPRNRDWTQAGLARLNPMLIWLARQRYTPSFFRHRWKRWDLFRPTMQNKRYRLKTGVTKPGKGTSQRPVFGILCPGGKVWGQGFRM